MIRGIALVSAILLSPAPAAAAPKTYEDCILENMKGIGDKTAALFMPKHVA
jgi:hypothetical protein